MSPVKHLSLFQVPVALTAEVPSSHLCQKIENKQRYSILKKPLKSMAKKKRTGPSSTGHQSSYPDCTPFSPLFAMTWMWILGAEENKTELSKWMQSVSDNYGESALGLWQTFIQPNWRSSLKMLLRHPQKTNCYCGWIRWQRFHFTKVKWSIRRGLNC